MVSIEVGGHVVVTGGQVWQNCVTVSRDVAALIMTGGHVGHGRLTVNTFPDTWLDGAFAVTSGQVGHSCVRVTVGPVPVVETGTTVTRGQVGQI